MHKTFAEYLNDLKKETAVANWDDENGLPISADKWKIVDEVVDAVTKVYPELHAFPSAGGDTTRYLRWTTDKFTFDLEIDENDTLLWNYKEKSGKIFINRVRGVAQSIDELVLLIKDCFG